jgi:PKD repeat protein
MKFLNACLSLAIAASAYQAGAQSNVWEKTLPNKTRLVVSRVEITGEALVKRIEKLKNTSADPTINRRYCTYYLVLNETGKSVRKRLWQREYVIFHERGLLGSLEPQFLDVYCDETNVTSVLLFKLRGMIYAEISKVGPTGIEFLCEGFDSGLAVGIPGVFSIESGQIDGTATNTFTITLTSTDNKTAVFQWQQNKWTLQSTTFPNRKATIRPH